MTPADVSAALHRRRLYIFDLDGTLADTSPIHEAAFREVLQPFAVPVNYASIAGLPTETAMQRLLAAGSCTIDRRDVAELVSAKRAAARRLIRNKVEFVPGAFEFLRFAGKVARLAIYSSGSRETIELTLSGLGIDGMFERIVSGDDVERPKPAPDGFARVLQETNVSVCDALVFEDAPAGIEGATKLGLDVIEIGPDAPPYARHPQSLLRTSWPALLQAATTGVP